MKKTLALASTILLAVLVTVWPASSRAQISVTPPELEGVDVVEHLGDALPADAIFKDDSGKMVKLGDYFDGKRPVLLVFAYHTCRTLCSMVMSATTNAIKQIPWTVGDEFDVVSISFDTRDTVEAAASKKSQIAAKYGRSGSEKGFHFLVGDEPNIKKVTGAAGFLYRYDAKQGEYAHPAVIFLLTPEGKTARYLYQIDPYEDGAAQTYNAGDVRLGLLEASQGRTISTYEKILLWCYHYDPKGKKYSLVAMNVMRLGGGLTAVLLGGLLVVLWRRERKKSAKRRADKGSVPAALDPSVHTPVRGAHGDPMKDAT